MYSQWIFIVIGMSDFTCMFQHTRLRFSLCRWGSFHIHTTSWVSFSSFYHVISEITCFPLETICGFLCTVTSLMQYLMRSHFLLDVECFIPFSSHSLSKRESGKKRWTENLLKSPHLRSGLHTINQYHFGVFLWSCNFTSTCYRPRFVSSSHGACGE